MNNIPALTKPSASLVNIYNNGDPVQDSEILMRIGIAK
jgi:hypothetical protein